MMSSLRPWPARVISSVFHPFLMPLWTLFALYLSDPILHLHVAAFLYLLVVLAINTLAPAISLWMMHKRGIIGDLEIRNRTERPLPFVVVWAYYLLTYFVITTGDQARMIPPVYLSLLLGLIVSIFGAILITRRFKMSMHGMGVGGTLGALVATQTLHFHPNWGLDIALILLAGAMGWSRIALGVHSHKEVYLGTLYGFAVMWLVVMWG